METEQRPNEPPFRLAKAAAPKKPFWFTLAELIVVITILAILATVGFLSLSGYSQDARNSANKANVRSAYAAVASEAALTGNSPRYYVIHDPSASLAGAFVYVDGAQAYLTGWAWDAAGTNYSAGNPDWAKLKLNPDKFRTSSVFADFFATASAAYSSTGITVGAADFVSATAAWRTRAFSYAQAASVSPSTGMAAVVGNFVAPTAAQVSAWAAAGLVKAPSGSGALVDGSASGASPSGAGGVSRYPGCDTDDIVLANGQAWAACNVGAANAWTGGVVLSDCGGSATDCALSKRNTLGSYFQWGRNDDVTAQGVPTSTQAASGTLAGGVGHSDFIILGWDWIATPNANLWGDGSAWPGTGYFTGQTTSDQTVMRGPCQSWYHVPTQSEWWSAFSTLNGASTNTLIWADDTTLVATLKLPLSGFRYYWSAVYRMQGVYGDYWSSTPSGTSSKLGRMVSISSTQVIIGSNSDRAYGFSVRCLKN